VAIGAGGRLYGATYSGGLSGKGTVFVLVPNMNGGYTQQVLHSFNGTDGRYPWGRPTVDAAGNVYGTTTRGGTRDVGVVYQVTP
jgi:uncharacterized repeat protein (TIGR03803 family)